MAYLNLRTDETMVKKGRQNVSTIDASDLIELWRLAKQAPDHAKLDELWSGDVDSDGMPCLYLVSYRCDACDEQWVQQWSCACDDECPSCGKDIEALSWMEWNFTENRWEK